MTATLLWLSLVLAFCVFRYGAVLTLDWCIALVALGLAAAVYVLRTPRREMAPPLEPWIRWPLVALPAWAALQLVPLPLPLLKLLSPARAELHEALAPVGPVSGFAPLAVAPEAALVRLSQVLGCIILFLLLRELAWRKERSPWTLAVPLVVIASLEAALGLWQAYGGDVARGTYVNRNHFAGLLEMALPFVALYALSKSLLKSMLSLTLAAVILVAIILSLSRMGFVAALFGLCVLFGCLWRPRYLLVLPLVAVLAFVFLPPDQLIARFAGLVSIEELPVDTRLQVWSETFRLVAAYPVFGCGLGGYESAFLKFKSAAPLHTVDYVHNDYLQVLAELGIVGFVLAVALGAGLLVRAARRRSRLAFACLGAMAAILLHSFTDFNLYIPANAAVLAWIAGIAAGLPRLAGRPLSDVRVIDVEPASTSVNN